VTFEIPEALGEADKATLLELLRSSQFIRAMEWLMKNHRTGLGNAKALLEHVPRKEGLCVYCNRELLDEGETICPVCNSLNFNW
jgi:Zn finger protein HypA/HybF involved in hydrogenase expression